MMPFSLTRRFEDEVEVDGQPYALDLSFDNVLRVFELFSDDEFEAHQRVSIVFDMFFLEPPAVSFQVKDQLVFFIFKEFLDIDLSDRATMNLDKEKFIDLYEDASRIYAVFIQDYQMDLFEYHGILHWDKFNVLLGQSLDRRLKEVVGIRAQKMPKATKHNADERKDLVKLKQVYALKGIDDPALIEERVDSAWDKVANLFRPGR